MSSALSTPTIIKIGLGVSGLAIAAFLTLRALAGSHEIGDRAFYYDESEARLYVAPAGKYPPLPGVGGAPDDGVRAIVYACVDNPAKDDRRIAYLQKYTPDLVARLEASEREHKSQGAVTNPIDRTFMSEQTLVRRVDDDQWRPLSSPEGQEIISVLSRKCDNGQYPKLCDPDD